MRERERGGGHKDREERREGNRGWKRSLEGGREEGHTEDGDRDREREGGGGRGGRKERERDSRETGGQ